MTTTEIHDALCRLQTSLNQAYRHIARSIADDSANDRLREALECLAAAKRAFDAIDNFASSHPQNHDN